MSGRGRGLSNLPSWMTRDGGGPPPPGFDRGGPPGGGYGGGPPGRYDDGRRPPDYRFDNRRDFPPRGGGDYRDRDRGSFRDDRGPPGRRGGGGGPPRGRRSHDRNSNDSGGGGTARGGGPMFRSLEEELAWLEERRRKRLARQSKFDQMPTPEQQAADAAAAALVNPAATDFSGIPADRNFSAIPQQTRHARRLYIGQLPPDVTEEELHVFFRAAIEQAIVERSPGTDPQTGRLAEDPVLSVYINYERRFCFLEFKTVEMTTACMALDGININGKGKVKVKRPNDYNPAMAPPVLPGTLPDLDISRLGIVSSTVQDGPNKVFVGGLHYHLAEDQVLELLQAFGKVKAFHLVKNDPDSMTSKGYCFVEYADPAVTQVAVLGLNGMDLGGGKMLTARVAGERAVGSTVATTTTSPLAVAAAMALPVASAAAAAQGRNIVGGYDVEELVDAAMGLKPMPTAPTHMDNFGLPVTRIAPTPLMVAAASPQHAMQPQQLAASYSPPQQPQFQQMSPQRQQPPPQPSALDIANAVQAAYGAAVANAVVTASAGASPINAPTRILVLSNMVAPEDLASDDDYEGLQDEVGEECAKFGTLKGMNIPRRVGGGVEASAIQKIFLEYATVQDAQAAERELAGRRFGPNVVQTTFFSESEYAAGRFK